MKNIYKYKPNWDETQERFSWWWRGESLNRPMLNLNVKRDTSLPFIEPEPFASLEDKYCNVEKQLAHYRKILANQAFVGEEFPALNVVWGLPLMAEYFGAKPEYLPDTVWYNHFVQDWTKDIDNLKLDCGNKIFQNHLYMLQKAKLLSNEEFFITIPDLMERLDILSALRGAQDLCYDFFDSPEMLHKLNTELDNSYKLAYDSMYDIVKDNNDNSSVWIAFQVWAKGRMAKLQCDFSALMTPDQFDEFMLPGLKKQCDEIDFCFYHLDGKDAIIHLDSIMSLEKLKALQWTPGDGQADGGSSKWYPIYKKARQHGKALWVYFRDGNLKDGIKAADELIKNIGSQGLYLHFLYPMSENEAKELINYANRYWSY